MKPSPKTPAERRIHERRRLTFSAGLGVMLATAAAAVAVGSLGAGCIFDEGGYDGGGRRSTAPTSTDTTTSIGEPTSTSTTPPTSTGPADSGQQVPDTGALDN